MKWKWSNTRFNKYERALFLLTVNNYGTTHEKEKVRIVAQGYDVRD